MTAPAPPRATGGNAKSVGGPGADAVTLGEGSDQFTWTTGDGSDHVDADGGTDTVLFDNGTDEFGGLVALLPHTDQFKLSGGNAETRAQPGEVVLP